jgi:hypothetical protein
MGPVWVLIKCLCFVVNFMSVVINVSIVVKIKYVNSDNIGDICDKLNFTTNYAHFTTTNTHFIKTHTKFTLFDTFGGTVPLQDLCIFVHMWGLFSIFHVGKPYLDFNFRFRI